MKRTITLSNRIDELTRISSFLKKCADQWGIPEPVTLSLNLVIEEAFTNVVKYAYSDNHDHDIDLIIKKKVKELEITLIDDGKQYDPTEEKEPDINLSANDRPIGGLGVFLIKKTMDNISYFRKDNKNHLVMVKKV
jgi:anti-sigma regulatory factor (Ser/Thr protein kinase)